MPVCLFDFSYFYCLLIKENAAVHCIHDDQHSIVCCQLSLWSKWCSCLLSGQATRVLCPPSWSWRRPCVSTTSTKTPSSSSTVSEAAFITDNNAGCCVCDVSYGTYSPGGHHGSEHQPGGRTACGIQCPHPAGCLKPRWAPGG